MIGAFIHIRFLDVIDIFLVALLLYQLYMLIRGTVAFNIFLGIAVIYIFWWAVRALKMELLSNILGSVLGVGVIALIIVFQQEIRRFLIYIGSRYVDGNRISFEKLLNIRFESKPQVKIRSILKAVMQFAQEKTGALIVVRRRSNLDMYAETGDILNAETSSRLLSSIFNKTSPLHDGAVIVENDRIKAARVILPVTEKLDLPADYGLRHRAGLGITEVTDSLVIIVSEETGQISIAEKGILQKNIPTRTLRQKLEDEFA
ncbi:MAG: TIGR00159 family protein [Bacteroidetes bacterium]|nr:MAG: TIGR00159 family protein [Bacteroidota bacterium]